MLARFVPLLVALSLCGCPDPNIYGTPRTLAPGAIQLQASMSGLGGGANGKTLFGPGLPTVGVRVGVAERVDVGLRVADFSSLSGDAKFNFVRGTVDVALDPGFQAYYYDLSGLKTAITAMQLHVPVLFGINFDEATTLVLTPGFVATLASAQAEGSGASTAQVAALSEGFGARLGVGLNVHTSRRSSWQPEVTAWHQFNGVGSWVCVFGLGVSFGAQPDYSDLDPGPAAQ